MPEKNSKFQWSRILWILCWPATWLALFMYYQVFTLYSSSDFVQNNTTLVQNIGTTPPILLLLIWGFHIAGSVALLKTVDPRSTFIRLTGEFLCGITGVAAVVLLNMVQPGYIVPFLNSPHYRETMLAPLLWQAVGLLVLFRVQKYWVWVATFICSSLPLLLTIRISPFHLIRSYCSDAQFAEVMARPVFRDVWKIDCFWTIVLVILACGTFPGIWTKLFRLNQEPAPANS